MIYGILPTMMIDDDCAVSSLVVLARVHQYSGHKAHVVTNTRDSADIESSATLIRCGSSLLVGRLYSWSCALDTHLFTS